MMEKKYHCKCHVKNINNKIQILYGNVYVASNNFLRIDYDNTTGFYISNFSISIDNIYDFEMIEKDVLEITCFEGMCDYKNVDSEYEKINNYLYKFKIYSSSATNLYEDIKRKKEENFLSTKKFLEERILQNKKKSRKIPDNKIKIKSLYGRTIPKKISYTGYVFDSYNGNCLAIMFDNISEKKYLGLQFGNSYENTSLFINYKDIVNYYIKDEKMHIKIYNDEPYGGVLKSYIKENLLYFGIPIDNNTFEIILESDDLAKIKKLLFEKIKLDENEQLINEKKERQKKEHKEKMQKYNNKSIINSGWFMILYFIFSPLIWIISLPFILLKNFIDLFKEDARNENEKTWDDWHNTRS